MNSNHLATKKAKYPRPERCLLVQAALWFVDGVAPIPDKAFLDAPKDFSSDNPDFTELFRALKFAHCDLRGELVLDFVPDRPSIILVQNHAYPRFQHQGYEFNLDDCDCKDVDFAGSSIKYQSNLILDEKGRKLLDAFKRENLASEKWREWTCYIRNVSVKFSDLEQSFSGREIGKAEATAKAEHQCRKWLLEKMSGGGKQEKTKSAYRAEAKNKFGVSARGFDRVWGSAVSESGNSDWSKPGRKS